MTQHDRRPSAPSRRPTLKTIANLSGLAQTTVSRALGDAPDISAETKALVRKIAAEVGYVPNRAGVRLRTGKTNVIALVLPTEFDAINMTARLIAAISSGLRGSHYHLVVIPESPEQTLLDPIKYVVETRSADAVIFNRVQPDDPRVHYLKERRFPFVTHGRSAQSGDHAWIDYDNEAFGRVAVNTLVAHGRRQLCLISPPTDQSYGLAMVNGATAAAQAAGVTIEMASKVTSDSPGEDIADAVAEMQADAPFDGLILPTPYAAMASVSRLESLGHRVGKDIDVFAKETFPILNMFHSGILALHEDIGKAGEMLAKAALKELSQNSEGHLQILDVPDGAEFL